jgi:hypothetical protein
LAGDTGFLVQIGDIGGSYGFGNYNMGSAHHLPFANGVWHHLEVDLNFQSETMNGYVDGQLLGTLAINPPSPATQITGLQLYSYGSGTTPQDVYFDNVSLSAVPEPSTSVMLGLGIVAFFGYRLRKRFA